MEDINDDDLIMYEESKEIKETIWKIWDIINDKDIILKLLLDSSLLKLLKNIQANNIFSDSKETNIESDTNKTEDLTNNELNKKNSEENGN